VPSLPEIGKDPTKRRSGTVPQRKKRIQELERELRRERQGARSSSFWSATTDSEHHAIYVEWKSNRRNDPKTSLRIVAIQEWIDALVALSDLS
jgi:hypothetical protein